MWDKLKLENLIFQKASDVQERIYGKNGALFSSGSDLCLQALLKVYNRFFRLKNQRDFPEEATRVWGEDYKNQLPFRGGLIPFQDVSAELFFEEYFSALFRNKNIDKKNKL